MHSCGSEKVLLWAWPSSDRLGRETFGNAKTGGLPEARSGVHGTGRAPGDSRDVVRAKALVCGWGGLGQMRISYPLIDRRWWPD